MKIRLVRFFVGFLLLAGFVYGAEAFSKVATVKPVLVQDGKEKNWCPICGMNLKMFYKTSHIAQLPNGKKRQYCSIRCLAKDMQEYDIDLKTIKVVDAKTQKIIQASSAYYVVGSRVFGTMSKISKLAFANKQDAKNFKKIYKGKIVSFQTALAMAKKSLADDIKYTLKKKQKKVYPKGQKIFKHLCKQDINPQDYIEINQLKASIVKNKLCKPLKEKQLQAVALYLWEVKRFGDLNNIKNRIVVNKDEKCPVCGMFTYKYPRWAAQIFYKHNDHIHHLSFDGVKDLMKFYFDPSKWGKYPANFRQNITKIVVTDYYSQEAIDATKAYYVIGSNIYGPMGNELIPFKNYDDAKVFKKDHFGTKILQFDKITVDDVYI